MGGTAVLGREWVWRWKRGGGSCECFCPVMKVVCYFRRVGDYGVVYS